MGHEERLLPPGLSARYVIRQETFAGTQGNGRVAPIPDLPETSLVRLKSTLTTRSLRLAMGPPQSKADDQISWIIESNGPPTDDRTVTICI